VRPLAVSLLFAMLKTSASRSGIANKILEEKEKDREAKRKRYVRHMFPTLAVSRSCSFTDLPRPVALQALAHPTRIQIRTLIPLPLRPLDQTQIQAQTRARTLVQARVQHPAEGVGGISVHERLGARAPTNLCKGEAKGKDEHGQRTSTVGFYQ
jgi:hypothetical protein